MKIAKCKMQIFRRKPVYFEIHFDICNLEYRLAHYSNG